NRSTGTCARTTADARRAPAAAAPAAGRWHGRDRRNRLRRAGGCSGRGSAAWRAGWAKKEKAVVTLASLRGQQDRIDQRARLCTQHGGSDITEQWRRALVAADFVVHQAMA